MNGGGRTSTAVMLCCAVLTAMSCAKPGQGTPVADSVTAATTATTTATSTATTTATGDPTGDTGHPD